MFGAEDVSSWRTTAMIMGSIASLVFIVQRTGYAFISNPLFEVCIFYLPAVLAVVAYLIVSRKRSVKPLEAPVPAEQ